jgi:chitinase
MHLSTGIAALIALAAPATAAKRFAMYYDQWHTAQPSKANTAGITHVILAFAPSTVFNSDPPGWWSPFVSPSGVRSLFDSGTKICMAIGGWGDNTGFPIGQKTEASRKTFAKAVASVMNSQGFDCVGMLCDDLGDCNR